MASIIHLWSKQLPSMNKIVFTLLVLLFSLNVASQTTVKGVVTDTKGLPIIGANVFIKDTYDGTSSDVNGVFSFETEETGNQTIVFTFIGYKTYEQTVNLEEKIINLTISLKEEINKLEGVVIAAGSFSAGEETKREVLKPLDIVTTAGSSADIAGALNTLPGTQTVGEEGRLFVRGGSGAETKTYIDGMQVLNAYNSTIPNTPSRGRFAPFMFKGTSFSTGGYSAEYGQALSSALILNSKDIPTINRADISIMSVGVDAAMTRVWNKSSFSGKIQYTNISPYFNLVKQSLELEKSPVAVDGNFAYRHKVNEDGMFKLYGNFNQSSLTSLISGIDAPSDKTRYKLENDYYYLNASYRDILSEKWSIKSGFAFTYSQDDIGINSDKVQENQNGFHAKVAMGYDPTEQVGVNMGIELYHRNYAQRFQEADHPTTNELSFDEQILAGFIETDVFASNNFVTRIGSRLEYNTLTDDVNLAPRLSMSYKTGDKSQVALAYGKFQQTADNRFIKFNEKIEAEKADHYILNYQWLTDKQTFRIEGYYKKYDNLVKFNGTDEFDPARYTNNGNGFAQGIDVFWRDNKSLKNVDYWISYSYLDTKRDYLNFPIEAIPTFASSHNFSAVYKHFIAKIKSQVGATYSFSSGRPYHNPNQPGFNAGKTKNYHDLSVNYTYLWKPNILFHAYVTNVLGRKNIFGYEYGNQPNEFGEFNRKAIKPMAPRFFFIGIFITLSKDKTLNELPNL